LASSGLALSHSISYKVPNPKSVSSNSNFSPFHSYTRLTFLNPPSPTNTGAPNSSLTLPKTLDSTSFSLSGSAAQSRPIDGSSSSSSSSTRLTPSTSTALAFRVTTQSWLLSENLRRRVARLAESSPAEPSKKQFSWRWVLTWNGARTSVTRRWATASGSRSLTSTSMNQSLFRFPRNQRKEEEEEEEEEERIFIYRGIYM
jgi:hypothetical protein